jgi:hypothetical protein
MFRRMLFWGLTIMLAAVIVSLIVRSRGEEKRQAAAAAEIVREFKPTATRVILPEDLSVVESRMELLPAAAKGQSGLVAHHHVAVRNDGPMAYAGIRLEFTYLDRGSRILESKTCTVTKPIPPRQTVSLGDVQIEGVAAGAVSCRTKILYADLQ